MSTGQANVAATSHKAPNARDHQAKGSRALPASAEEGGWVEAAGNLAVQQLFPAGAVKAKLTISQPDDPDEQEADLVADRIMRMGDLGHITSSSGVVHRTCAACDGGGSSCPRCAEDHVVQRKASVATNAQRSASRDSRIVGLRGCGEPLSPSVRAFFESRFGRDLSHVRLHTDAHAAAIAGSINARAFTVGQHIGFGFGQYAPGSSGNEVGRELLTHELAHVVMGHSGLRRTPDDADAERIRAPEAPKPDAEETTPYRPAGENFYFRGHPVADDTEFMRGVLRRVVAEKGLENAGDWVAALQEREGRPGGGIPLPFSAHTRGYGGLRPRSPLDAMADLRSEEARERVAPTAIPTTVRIWRGVHAEALAYIALFETSARAIVRDLLADSRARIEAERLRYGLTRTRTTEWRRRREAEGGFVTEPVTTVHDTMEDTLPGRGLAGAAQDLLDKNTQIDALVRRQHDLMVWRRTGPEEYNFVVPVSRRGEYDRLGGELRERERERMVLRATYTERYPILARLTESPAALHRIAGGRSGGAASELNQQIEDRLNDIAEVESELVPGGRVVVFKLPEIVTLAKSATGAGQPTSLGRMKDKLVDDKRQQLEDDISFRNTVLAVLGIALALVAALPSGGSSLVAGAALLAGIAGAGLSVAMAAEHLAEYNIERALTGTDFDRARAISSDDPSLFWLAVDVVAAAADLGAAASATRAALTGARSAFRSLAGAARTAVAAEGAEAATSLAELRRLAREAEAAHNAPGLAERVVSSVERLRASRGSVERALGGSAGHEARAVGRGVREIESAAAHALASAPTRLGGHTVSVLPNGWIVRCTVCGTIRAEFAMELARSPGHARRVFEIEEMARTAAVAGDRAAAARAAAAARGLADELEAVRRTRDIRLYRGVRTGAIEDLFLMDHRLVVDMPFVGRGEAVTNAAGWLRDASHYWEELARLHPEAFSAQNLARIRGAPPLLGPVAPLNDPTFRRVFNQYDVTGLRGQPLIHHHIGGGGQAVAIPAPLHPGSGGIHNVERAAGIWGGEDIIAEMLDRLLRSTPPS